MKPVPVMFEEQVKRTPDATALSQGPLRKTYRELNKDANRLAHDLRARGVVPETLVGVSITQSIEAVVAVMGILKAGGAYVPLDPGYPAERLDHILKETNLGLIVDRDTVMNAKGDIEDLRCDFDLDTAAYVLYTSGSTGKPKGVVGVHRSILNGLLSVDYAPNERCCLNASLNFGLSLANLFLPLMVGIPLVILSEEQIKDLNQFADALESEAITRVVLVPSALKHILDLPQASKKLRSICEVGVAGAALTQDLLRRFAEVMPRAKLHNTYSASEIGTLATMWNVEPTTAASGAVVIGRAVANTRIYLLDAAMNAVASAEDGEIYVGAPHLARGYLNQPAETARCFVSYNGERVFRTGDLGRLCGNGEIEFLGRADDMIKIRGFRIELFEIECALTSHEAVHQAAAAAHEIGGELRLVGYIVADRALSVKEIRKYLYEKLPEYMVPSIFVFLDSLPLLSNRKLDRAALPVPDLDQRMTDTEYVESRNDIEAELTTIWTDLFGLEQIGVHDHFLELGGDSLFAVQATSRIRDRFGIDLSLETLFEFGTIANIADCITTHSTGTSTDKYVRSAAR